MRLFYASLAEAADSGVFKFNRLSKPDTASVLQDKVRQRERVLPDVRPGSMP